MRRAQELYNIPITSFDEITEMVVEELGKVNKEATTN